jgi:hypothetical protein
MSVTEIPELRIELAPAAEAVERAGRKLADLVSAAEEPERDVRGLEWTLHELVAHLAARSGRFAAYLSGTAAPEGEIAGIAEENRRDVAERRGRPVADLVGSCEPTSRASRARPTASSAPTRSRGTRGSRWTSRPAPGCC